VRVATFQGVVTAAAARVVTSQAIGVVTAAAAILVMSQAIGVVTAEAAGVAMFLTRVVSTTVSARMATLWAMCMATFEEGHIDRHHRGHQVLLARMATHAHALARSSGGLDRPFAARSS